MIVEKKKGCVIIMNNAFEKLSKIQNDNPDRYCDLDDYKEGYICFLDILGFSEFVKKTDNFTIIRDTINDFISYQINKEVNENIFKTSIGSDSIVITIDKENLEKIIGMIDVLEYLIRNIMFLRKLIIEKIGTDIRAGITYGKYVHEGYKGQLYFGPAICDAVNVSEKCGVISCVYGTVKQPAGIFIDKKVFDEGIESIYTHKDYLKELNTGNFILNPFIFEYYNLNPYTYYTQIEKGEVSKDIAKYEWWNLFCEKQKQIFTRHDNEDHKEKYSLYPKMLEDFHQNYVEKIDRTLKM